MKKPDADAVEQLARRLWIAYVRAQAREDRQDYAKWETLEEADPPTVRGFRAIARVVLALGQTSVKGVPIGRTTYFAAAEKQIAQLTKERNAARLESRELARQVRASDRRTAVALDQAAGAQSQAEHNLVEAAMYVASVNVDLEKLKSGQWLLDGVRAVREERRRRRRVVWCGHKACAALCKVEGCTWGVAGAPPHACGRCKCEPLPSQTFGGRSSSAKWKRKP
jgi:hypothetical protein